MSTPTTEGSKRERVRVMCGADFTPREIAKALDISTQAVYQHMKALGIPPPRKAQP